MKKKILSLVLILMLTGAMFVLTGCGETTTEESNSSSESQKAEDEIVVVSSDKSYVGYYADIDNDGTVDGIIYADLMIPANYSQWADNNRHGTYSWTVLTESDELKSYYVSQESYIDDFGTADVISPVNGTTGRDRFYVMALDDVDSNWHCWYDSAYRNGMSDYLTATSGDFGTGYNNTETMIEYWNASYYGTQNESSSYTDMWGLDAVQTGYTNGWFIPSRAEWSAFAAELGITSSNYEQYGLDSSYWTSSDCASGAAWHVFFSSCSMLGTTVDCGGCVRLGTTF